MKRNLSSRCQFREGHYVQGIQDSSKFDQQAQPAILLLNRIPNIISDFLVGTFVSETKKN